MSYFPSPKKPGLVAKIEHRVCGCTNTDYMERKTLSYVNHSGYVDRGSTALPDGSYKINLYHCCVCGRYHGHLSTRRGYCQLGLDTRGELMPALAYALWATEDAAYYARLGREKGDPAYYTPEERKANDIAYYDNRPDCYLGYCVSAGSVAPTEQLWSGAPDYHTTGGKA